MTDLVESIDENSKKQWICIFVVQLGFQFFK